MLVFRVDANEIISGGHVRRCLSIAECWRKQGGKCLFVSADRQATVFIEPLGFECEVLGTDWQDINAEISSMRRLLDNCERPVLLIDTYQVNSDYVDELSSCAKIGYLGTKRLVASELDFIINYSINIDTEFYANAYNACTKVMLGPSYAPLGSAFRVQERKTSSEVHSVLLTTGNADGAGMTSPLIESLGTVLFEENIKLLVVIGPLNRDGVTLRKRYAQNQLVRILENVPNMADLMCETDIAISACGTTLYELAACEVPTVGFSISAEQDANGETEELRRYRVIAYAGRAYEEKRKCIEAICREVTALIHDKERRAQMVRRFHALVDGAGCERICDEVKRLEALQ